MSKEIVYSTSTERTYASDFDAPKYKLCQGTVALHGVPNCRFLVIKNRCGETLNIDRDCLKTLIAALEEMEAHLAKEGE